MTVPQFSIRKCDECGYLASAQGQRAVLEAMLEHHEWKLIREMRRAVYPEVPVVEPKKVST